MKIPQICTYRGFLPQNEAFLFASAPAEREDVDAWARQTLRREPEAVPATAGELEAAGTSEVMGDPQSSSWFQYKWSSMTWMIWGTPLT